MLFVIVEFVLNLESDVGVDAIYHSFPPDLVGCTFLTPKASNEDAGSVEGGAGGGGGGVVVSPPAGRAGSISLAVR